MIKVWITISESDWKTTAICQCSLDDGQEGTQWNAGKCGSGDKQELACTRHRAENSWIFISWNKGQKGNVTAGLGRGDTPIHTDPHGTWHFLGRLGLCFTAVAPEPLSFKLLQQSLLETFGFMLLIVSQMEWELVRSLFSSVVEFLLAFFSSHPEKEFSHSFPHIVCNQWFLCNGY